MNSEQSLIQNFSNMFGQYIALEEMISKEIQSAEPLRSFALTMCLIMMTDRIAGLAKQTVLIPSNDESDIETKRDLLAWLNTIDPEFYSELDNAYDNIRGH